MTVNELADKLKALPGAEGMYSLEGKDVPDGVTLTHANGIWVVYTMDDRGERGGFRTYPTEDEACRAFLEEIEPEARRRWNFAHGRGYVDDPT
jgi:hypothetical protein